MKISYTINFKHLTGFCIIVSFLTFKLTSYLHLQMFYHVKVFHLCHAGVGSRRRPLHNKVKLQT